MGAFIWGNLLAELGDIHQSSAARDQEKMERVQKTLEFLDENDTSPVLRSEIIQWVRFNENHHDVNIQKKQMAFSAILARSSHITRGAVKRFVEAHIESKERIVASEYDIKRVRRWEAIVMRVLRQNVDANGAADSGWRFAGLQTFTESLFLAADEHENRAGMGGVVLEERLGSKAHSGVRFAVSESSPIGNGSRIPGSQALVEDRLQPLFRRWRPPLPLLP